jgi:hypothetical protein
MIEVSLIEDNANYPKERLDVMRSAFLRNFILHQDSDLEKRVNHSSPEMRIYMNLLQGLLPEILFRALGEDLADSISGNFLNAFLKPDSEETPSLVFHFVGKGRSFEFKIKSRDEKALKEAPEKMIEKLLSVIGAEELPPESILNHTYHFENGDWSELK